MRRNYDTAYYRDLLAKVSERLPESAIGSDVIVGFPGESDAQFERSMEYFAMLPLTYFHVFPYSTRRGTAAVEFTGQLSTDVKKRRARRMRELGNKKKQEFCASFVGRVASVLVEGKREGATGLGRGFSRNYLPVLLPTNPVLINREVNVQLERLEDGWLIGRPLGSSSQDIRERRFPN
jgi:threonylcarbamoyladenosine tRNA methylthiotransferase MtaB